MIFYSFVYEKRYNRMGSLDEKISVVKAKPWLVSLVCAVFIAYPNLAWIFCDMSYLAPNDQQARQPLQKPTCFSRRYTVST